MRLHEIMNDNPKTVAPGDTLIFARSLMVQGGFRHLPVVEDGKLVGVLTERDIFSYLAATIGESFAGSPDHLVSQAMCRNPKTAAASDAVTEAAALMAEHKIGCLPVTDGDTLVGLVTTTDILRAADAMSREAGKVRPEATGYRL